MPYKDLEKRRAYMRGAAKLYRKRHPERVKSNNAKWRSRVDNKDKIKQYCQKYKTDGSRQLTKRKHDLKSKYNLTLEQFEELRLNQYNKCKICLREFTTAREIQIDHDHVTNKVRSLLCVRCNFGIGMLKESNFILARAIAYLKHFGSMSQEDFPWDQTRFVDLLPLDPRLKQA